MKNPHSKIQIVHVLNLDTVGGVEELFIHFLAMKSNSRLFEHHVLVTSDLPHHFFENALKQHSASFIVEKYACSVKIPKCLKFLRLLRRKHYIRTIKPEMIVLWNRFENLQSFTCPFRREEKNSSCIVYYEHGASWIEKSQHKLDSFFASVSHVIANSDAAKNVLQKKWNIQNPISVIANPLKPDIKPRTLPKSYTKSHGPFHLGYIGRLINLKGVPLLLHTIKILAEKNIDVSLWIAGDGEMRSKLCKMAENLGITSSVRFLGCIRDVSEFYDEIDTLIIPSIREPLGLVAQEAALRGCPVIASCVDGLPEVVQHNNTGILIHPTLPLEKYADFGGSVEKLPDLVYDPEIQDLTSPRIVDPFRIAEAVEKLINDPVEYQRLSKNAISFAQKRPSFEQYADIIEKDLYNHFLAHKGKAHAKK